MYKLLTLLGLNSTEWYFLLTDFAMIHAVPSEAHVRSGIVLHSA